MDSRRKMYFNHNSDITLEHIIGNSRIEPPTSIFHRQGQNLLFAFAGNVDPIGNSRIRMSVTFIGFEKEEAMMGLQVN